MSKGYPTRTDDSYPILDALLPEEACMVCKRRRREEPSSLCGRCAAILHPAGKG